MSGQGLVALLEPVVLSNVMEVVTSDDNRAGHFGRDHDAPKTMLN